MNSKTFYIGILSVTALILTIAQFVPVTPIARAETAIKDRDYMLTTSPAAAGNGDNIYLTDNRSGMMAVFGWDAAKRGLQVRAVVQLSDAFR
jgi:hypothetical protein